MLMLKMLVIGYIGVNIISCVYKDIRFYSFGIQEESEMQQIK
jgi:hypothetical protein